MTTEQAQKVLDELQGVRPEMLNGEAKRLFEAIMKIADERDELKQKLKEVNKGINSLIQSRRKWKRRYYKMKDKNKNLQNKIIDLMAEKIYEEGVVWDNKEEVKQYFENKTKEVEDTNDNKSHIQHSSEHNE